MLIPEVRASINNSYLQSKSAARKLSYCGDSVSFTSKKSPRVLRAEFEREQREGDISFVKTLIDLELKGLGLQKAVSDSLEERLSFLNNCVKDGDFVKRPEHIEFKFSDAERFAKDKLGIAEFRVPHLFHANIVNHALVKYSNLTKGKGPLPKRVVYEKFLDKSSEDSEGTPDGSTIATMQAKFGNLRINSNLFHHCRYLHKDLVSHIHHEIGHMLYAFPETYSEAEEYIRQLETALKNSKFNEEVHGRIIALLKEKLVELENPPQKTRKDKLSEFALKITGRYDKYKRDNYLQWYGAIENMRTEYREDLCRFNNTGWDIFHDAVLDEEEISIADKVSWRASKSVHEFIAETFSFICMLGIDAIPQDAMEMYHKYKGPMLEGFYEQK